MHLVYDINLIFPLWGGIGNFVHNFTYIVNTIIGCRINLNHVHAGVRRNGTTDTALSAGTVLRWFLTVNGPGKDLRHSSLTCSSGSGKQVRMSDSIGPQLIF